MLEKFAFAETLAMIGCLMKFKSFREKFLHIESVDISIILNKYGYLSLGKAP